MPSSENEMFQLLLEEIKKMNQNLETASFAINNLTLQINSLPDNVNSIMPPMANANKAPDNSNSDQESDEFDSKQTPRILGYVNWDSSHDFLKSQKLVKMSALRDLLIKMDSTFASRCSGKAQPQKYDSYGRAITSGEEGTQALNHFAPLNEPGSYTVINKELRFPLDAVYLDVASEVVKKEIDFMNKLNVKPTDGVVERFMTICQKEMLTCKAFEKKYGLKWA